MFSYVQVKFHVLVISVHFTCHCTPHPNTKKRETLQSHCRVQSSGGGVQMEGIVYLIHLVAGWTHRTIGRFHTLSICAWWCRRRLTHLFVCPGELLFIKQHSLRFQNFKHKPIKFNCHVGFYITEKMNGVLLDTWFFMICYVVGT